MSADMLELPMRQETLFCPVLHHATRTEGCMMSDYSRVARMITQRGGGGGGGGAGGGAGAGVRSSSANGNWRPKQVLISYCK